MAKPLRKAEFTSAAQVQSARRAPANAPHLRETADAGVKSILETLEKELGAALIWRFLMLSNITHAQFLNRDKESQKSLTARSKACIIPACSLRDVCPVRKVESIW